MALAINYYVKHPRRAASGSELPILLIHGIADGALTWSFVLGPAGAPAPSLREARPARLWLFGPVGRSWPRHARRDARHCSCCFLREVIGRPTLVVGNSMGGWLAVKLGWAVPRLVRGSCCSTPAGRR